MPTPLIRNTTPVQPRPDIARSRRWATDSGPREPGLLSCTGFEPKLLYQRFGLRENPFGVTPKLRDLYQSRTHTEAMASLIIGIEYGVGFQALIAPPGMGKTTVLFNLLEQFRDVARTAFLFQSHGNSLDFLRRLILEFGDEGPVQTRCTRKTKSTTCSYENVRQASGRSLSSTKRRVWT